MRERGSTEGRAETGTQPCNLPCGFASTAVTAFAGFTLHEESAALESGLSGRRTLRAGFPVSIFEHIFNKCPVAFGAVADEYVGDCAD